ncbi:hypothetical protein BD779DRAFT_1466783 [Infundibulicybe gibba]|nr:hypothetical protein BD779DRAFT_1466783 [Infundibulicybe gibba]
MIFFPTLFSLLAGFVLPIFAAPTESTSGIILAPAQGAEIMPGSLFDFKYDARADYGISSFNYTVWLFTTPPQSFSPADNFATGYFFGRFSEPNYPANPYPNNPPPTHFRCPTSLKTQAVLE